MNPSAPRQKVKTLCHCSSRVKSIFHIANIPNAKTPAQFVKPHGFVISSKPAFALPIHQTKNPFQSDDATTPLHLDRRIQMFVAICQLGPSTRCTNLSSAIVQICQTCRIVEWLTQASWKTDIKNCCGIFLTLKPPFFVGLPVLEGFWKKKEWRLKENTPLKFDSSPLKNSGNGRRSGFPFGSNGTFSGGPNSLLNHRAEAERLPSSRTGIFKKSVCNTWSVRGVNGWWVLGNIYCTLRWQWKVEHLKMYLTCICYWNDPFLKKIYKT